MRLTGLAYDTRAKTRSLATYWRGATSAERKSGRSRLPGPLTLQLQTVDRCPASCVMCPNAVTRKRGPIGFMDDRLYARVLLDVQRAGTVKRLVLMLQNEPLLDARLEERVRAARANLGPAVDIAVVTNGELMLPGRADSLFDAGLTELSISVDARTFDTYRRIRTGLDFEQVCRNVEAALARRPRGNIIVRFLRQRENQREERDFVRHWRGRGAGVFVSTVVNRAGSLQSFHAIRQVENRPVHRVVQRILGRVFPFCTLPFTAMAVLADGRAVLCCHDWDAQAPVGDCARQSLADIWNGPALCGTRRALMASRAHTLEPCAQCSLRYGPWGFDRAD